jgi:hypothetical protein
MAREDAKEKAEKERRKTKGKAKHVVVKVGKLWKLGKWARGFVGGM